MSVLARQKIEPAKKKVPGGSIRYVLVLTLPGIITLSLVTTYIPSKISPTAINNSKTVDESNLNLVFFIVGT